MVKTSSDEECRQKRKDRVYVEHGTLLGIEMTSLESEWCDDLKRIHEEHDP